MYLAEIFLLQIWQQTALVWFQGYSLPNKQKKALLSQGLSWFCWWS